MNKLRFNPNIHRSIILIESDFQGNSMDSKDCRGYRALKRFTEKYNINTDKFELNWIDHFNSKFTWRSYLKKRTITSYLPFTNINYNLTPLSMLFHSKVGDEVVFMKEDYSEESY